MSKVNSSESRDRPFPWLCVDCFTKTVVPTVMDHTATVKHDGSLYEIQLSNIEIPCCQTCGEIYPTAAVDDQVSNALRQRMGLLMPAEIRAKIKHLGIKQQEVARHLGVAPDTISHWVNGALVQSKAMDNLLRVYFALPEAREVLGRERQDPEPAEVT